MKLKHKILWTILAVLGLTALVHEAHSTGVTPNNTTQSGTITYGAGVWTNTVTFPVAYTQPPVVQFFPTSTNATPLTNSLITTTNFTLIVAATNTTVNWTAFLGYPRVLTGTNTVTGGTLITNTFSPPFFYTPILNIEGTSTNVAGIVAVQSVTPSNFVAQATTTQLFYWGAFGVSATPGIMNVTY